MTQQFRKNDALVCHSFKENAELVSGKQWAYRAGHSTKLLSLHLTETWRSAVDSELVVAVAFVDFKKALDSVCHTILETKLQKDFGIKGPLSDWLKTYLKDRQQVTCVKGVKSGLLTTHRTPIKARQCSSAERLLRGRLLRSLSEDTLSNGVNKTRLLEMTVDHKLSWVSHTLDHMKS